MTDGYGAGAWALQTARRLWGDFMACEPSALRGEDPEQLHDIRVACRRLRTAIASFQRVLPPDMVTAREDLRWIGRELGRVRDLDVQLAATRAAFAGIDKPPAGTEPILAALAAQREQALPRMLGAVNSSRFESLALRITSALRESSSEGEGQSLSLQEFAQAMLQRYYRRYRKARLRLSETSRPERYHDVRRKARRLRFATEFIENAYGEPARALAHAAGELQDLLGQHQDCYAAIELRRKLRRALPPEAQALVRQLDERDRKRAAAFRKQASRAFRRLEKRWKLLNQALH